MKNSALALLSIFIFISLFGSCTKEPVVGPINIDIEDEFNILLWETLSENERGFHLNIETILANSCENAEIEYRLGGLHFTLHQTEEGRFHLKNAVKLNIDYSFIISELFPSLENRPLIKAIISDSKNASNQ